jgi:hypothetical protein
MTAETGFLGGALGQHMFRQSATYQFRDFSFGFVRKTD